MNLLLGPPASSSLPLRTAVAALLDLALLALAAGLLRRGALRAGRRPFEPLPILPRLPWRAGRLRRALRPGRGARPSPAGGRAAAWLSSVRPWRIPLRDAWAAFGLLLVVLCLPLSLLASRGGGTAAPALADAPRVRPDDWAALERLHGGERGPRLPDLSDFAAHAAFQEGFPLGRPWRFPRPGERVTLSAYLPGGEGGPVVQTRRTLKRYPPGWLAGTLARGTAPSVERLLLDQGAGRAGQPGDGSRPAAAPAAALADPPAGPLLPARRPAVGIEVDGPAHLWYT